jgi:2-keto-3-deoxy-L-rhamnonate aldolase RhmA
MGKMGRPADPEVQDAILRVKRAAEAVKRPLGIFAPTAEAVQSYIQTGYTLVAVGIDTLLLGHAAKAITALLK